MLAQVKAGPAWRSWLMLVISGGGALLAFIGSGLMLVTGGLTLLTVPDASVNSQSMLNLGWVTLLVGLLCLPAVVGSVRELRGNPAPARPLGRKLFFAASAGMIIWTALVLIFKPVETSSLAWLLLPPLVVLVAVLPLWWYLEIGRRGFLPEPPARVWSIASFSLVVTLPVILVLELMLFAVIAVLVGFYLGLQPEFSQQLSTLEQMLQDPNLNPQVIDDILMGYLKSPGALAGLLAVIAGIMPILEELLKPLAIWLFAGDRLTPRQGFAAGMVSGACFALWENLTAISAAGDGSGTEILIARVGTGLLHIISTGLVGWGMTSFWQSRRYLWRMIGAFILAVTLHGLWNASSIISGFAPLLNVSAEAERMVQVSGSVTLGVLVTLIIVNFAILLYANARLRKSQLSEAEALASSGALLQPAFAASAPTADTENTIEGDRINNTGDPHGVD